MNEYMVWWFSQKSPLANIAGFVFETRALICFTFPTIHRFTQNQKLDITSSISPSRHRLQNPNPISIQILLFNSD
ncbi:hypothetical protein L6452_07579 [Arctium lappa]|uniref:Uncharacterized protein n=1 Tax=Arctium lappa TaxID=4217 RepID=A0ACB9ELG0_ARCLA|nr:hypothetical protein L6452_07579 [Arctium lappa]